MSAATIKQHDLLGDEMPPPALSFAFVCVWDSEDLRVTAVPLMGKVHPDYFKELESVVREAILEEFAE